MIHVAAQVRHVVHDAGAQAQVAHAVVAGGVLAALVAQPNDCRPRVKGQHPDLQLNGSRSWSAERASGDRGMDGEWRDSALTMLLSAPRQHGWKR